MTFKELLKEASEGNKEAIVSILELYNPLLVKTSKEDDNFDEDLYQEQRICLMRCILKYASNHGI